MKKIWPALLVLLISSAYVVFRLAAYEFDPAALAEIGTRYAELDPNGSEGYDGQFNLYIARDPSPDSVAPHLDVPAYRYQRILYPLLARLLAFGSPGLIPWTLILVNLAAHSAATYLLADLLARREIATSYALIYGLWVGLISGVGLFLHEPVAHALVILAFYFRDRDRYVPMGLVMSLALFAKETTAVFWLALLIADFIDRELDRGHVVLLVGGLGFAVWQGWLWLTFGMPGIASGGEMATPFEWIPFMGFLRIGFASLKALGLYTLIFVPTVIIPTVYVLIQAFSRLRQTRSDAFAWSGLLSAAAIVFLPFSTFREPLGLVRVFVAVILSFLLLNAEMGKRRNLNFAYFWIAMLVLLVNQ